MNVFSLLLHISVFIKLGKDVKEIVDELIQHKESFPSNAEYILLIDDAVALVGAGIIALPDDIIQKIDEALAALKAALV